MLFFHEELNEFGKEEPHGPVDLYTTETQAPVFPPDMILKSQELKRKGFCFEKISKIESDFGRANNSVRVTTINGKLSRSSSPTA